MVVYCTFAHTSVRICTCAGRSREATHAAPEINPAWNIIALQRAVFIYKWESANTHTHTCYNEHCEIDVAKSNKDKSVWECGESSSRTRHKVSPSSTTHLVSGRNVRKAAIAKINAREFREQMIMSIRLVVLERPNENLHAHLVI